MPSSPEATVVLCIYNGEKYLAQAIDSVLQQDFQNFELFLLDDGSTDGTLQIIREYEKRDRRCKVFTGPNLGLIGSRNLGISHANSDLIVLMDADDICMPNRLSTQIRYLNEHPDCVAVGAAALLIDPQGDPLKELLLAEDHAGIDAAHMAGHGGAIVNPSTMMRKQAVLQVGGYRKEFLHAEDIDLFLRLAEIGQLANIPVQLLQYRQHLGSIGYQHAQKQRDSADKAVNSARQRRGLAPLSVAQREQSGLEIRTSRFDVYNKWAWWALNGGHLKTARRYAWLAIRTAPFKRSNLRLLACIARGY